VTLEELVTARVENMYHDQELSCVHAVLKILAELFDIEVTEQIFAASAGMYGGGGEYGAQCGLVQGGILFLGLLGSRRGMDREAIGKSCHALSAQAEAELGSLLCREVRPEGFAEDNPPHLCEPRTVQSIVSTARFLADRFGLSLRLSD